VVGAIATNLGATSTDRKLSIKSWERTLMFATFIVMAAIELSLLIDKPNARYFAVTILAVGLILRGLVQERRMKKEAAPLLPASMPVQLTRNEPAVADAGTGEAILCAIRGTGRTLDFALREARETGRRLYLLFVREQRFMTEQDTKRKWQEDPEASQIFDAAKKQAGDRPPPVLLCGQRVCRRSHSRHCRYAGRIPSDSRRSAAHRSSTFCEAISCAKSPTCCRRKSICWFTHNMLSRGSTRAEIES